MMRENILEIRDLSKIFCQDLKQSLYYGLVDIFNETVRWRGSSRATLRKHEFWALKDVSFELNRGETIGIIGHNGAGKSTLLKLINGIMKPSQGQIKIQGRVGALIELGTGFNPILTGRENVYVNGSILGLSKAEINKKFDEIVEFAGIGAFINAPVQTYSSGMKVRLGFSVAAHLDPDLLIIDEILSVGDSSFRERCFKRLADFRMQGGSVLLVSHNSLIVEQICDKVVWLDHGKMIDFGDPSPLIEAYELRMLIDSREKSSRPSTSIQTPESDSLDEVEIESLTLHEMSGLIITELKYNIPFEIRLKYKAKSPILKPYFSFAISKFFNGQSVPLAGMNMHWDGIEVDTIPSEGTISCIIDSPRLAPGNYHIIPAILRHGSGSFGKKWYYQPRKNWSFTITSGSLREKLPATPSQHIVSSIPPLILDHTWRVNEKIISPAITGHCSLKETLIV